MGTGRVPAYLDGKVEKEWDVFASCPYRTRIVQEEVLHDHTSTAAAVLVFFHFVLGQFLRTRVTDLDVRYLVLSLRWLLRKWWEICLVMRESERRFTAVGRPSRDLFCGWSGFG